MANTFALICSNTLAHILSRQTPSLVSVQTPSLLSFQMFVYFFVAHLRREMARPCQQLRTRSKEGWAWHEQEEPWACPCNKRVRSLMYALLDQECMSSNTFLDRSTCACLFVKMLGDGLMCFKVEGTARGLARRTGGQRAWSQQERASTQASMQERIYACSEQAVASPACPCTTLMAERPERAMCRRASSAMAATCAANEFAANELSTQHSSSWTVGCALWRLHGYCILGRRDPTPTPPKRIYSQTHI
jgi:hypothetical protein